MPHLGPGMRIARGPIFDRDPAPLPSDFDFGRVRGMLLGLAIGDALGRGSEGKLPQERRAQHGEIEFYLPQRYAEGRRVGLPSDDTQLAFWTVEHLIECAGRLDPAALAAKFAERRIFGIGHTVSEFTRRARRGLPWHECGPESAGNGALMRIAPILLPHLRQPSRDLWIDAANCAMITHNDAASIASCVAFVSMLWDLLHLRACPAPEWWVDRYVEVARPLEGETAYDLRGGSLEGYQGPLWQFVDEHVRDAWSDRLQPLQAFDRWHSGAYLLETVPCVLFLLMCFASDPRKALIRAVNDTKDNDTIAAIVGAAVGALHGEDALPAAWRDNLLGRTGAAEDGRAFDLLDQAQMQFWMQ